MKRTFTFRLDERTNQRLKVLAARTYRSRGAMLRLLIDLASIDRELNITNVTDSLANIDSNDSLHSIIGESMEVTP